jgi:hypothetical protein
MKKPLTDPKIWGEMNDFDKAWELISLALHNPRHKRPSYTYLLDFITEQAVELRSTAKRADFYQKQATMLGFALLALTPFVLLGVGLIANWILS